MGVEHVGRFLSGRPLDGRLRTDARFLYPGTRALTPTGHASRWAMLAGWQRASVRLAVLSGAVSGAWGWVVAPTVTAVAACVAGAAGAGWSGWWVWTEVRSAQHHRTHVRPLALALARQFGLPDSTDPDRIVSVPRTFRTAPDPGPDGEGPDPDHPHAVVVRLPVTLVDGAEVRRTITRIVCGRLDLDPDGVAASWRMSGGTPSVTFTVIPGPPRRVTFGDIAAELARTDRPGAPVLGVAAGGRVVRVDLDSESPHIAISAGTGGGKSVLVKGIAAQLMHEGCQVVIADPKRFSLSLFRDLGVTYLRSAREIHDGLLTVRAELQRRYRLLDTVSAEEEDTVLAGLPRLVFLFEEQSIGMRQLTQLWAELRVKGDPKRSPALSAYDEILAAGRALRVHMITVCQLLTVSTTGGDPTARSNYGCRILARTPRAGWVMLAPEFAPFPRQSKIRGRMHVALADTLTEIQAPLWGNDDLRAWATSGPVTVPVTWNGGPGLRDTAGVTPQDRLYTLAEAAREPWCASTYDALRQAASRGRRAGTWPVGVVAGGVERFTAGQLRAALGVPTADGGDR